MATENVTIRIYRKWYSLGNKYDYFPYQYAPFLASQTVAPSTGGSLAHVVVPLYSHFQPQLSITVPYARLHFNPCHLSWVQPSLLGLPLTLGIAIYTDVQVFLPGNVTSRSLYHPVTAATCYPRITVILINTVWLSGEEYLSPIFMLYLTKGSYLFSR